MTRLASVARWEADAAGRLRGAAMELYATQGYEQTTVAEIAARAGVTARTFFRHFTDKREVLFAGSDALEADMVTALAAAGGDPMAAVAAALDAAVPFLGRDHALSRRRRSIIAANPDLLERELIKMARLSAALRAALRDRGVPEPDAALAASCGIVAFQTAFEQWVAEPADTGLGDRMRATFDRMREVVRAS